MRWLAVVVLLGVLVGCGPGGHGWKCDHDGDCDRGLSCKTVEGKKGFSTVCMKEGETAAASYGWFDVLFYPLLALGLGAGLVYRLILWRIRRRESDPDYRPKRRRRVQDA